MGASASKPEPVTRTVEEKYEFGRHLLNKLEDVKEVPAPSPDTGRQEVLDSTIKQKIHEELNKLRKQEEEVQKQIQLALEKENIENQTKSWFSGGDKGQSSVLLQQELDRVKQNIEKYNKQRDVSSFPGLKEARDAVISCYREKPERSLDCWKQVEEFKHAVAKAEKTLMADWK